MDFNKKIVKIGLLLIVISLILNITTKMNSRLQKIVFLKMYVEKDLSQIYEQDKFKLYGFRAKYIVQEQNTMIANKIKKISFKEEPRVKIDFRINNVYGKKTNRYKIKDLDFSIDFSEIHDDFKELELNNMIITLNNGEEFNVNLGSIIVYNDKNEDLRQGGFFTDYKEYEMGVVANKDLTVTKIGLEKSCEFDKSLETWIDRNDLNNLNIELKEDDTFCINHRLNFNKGILSKYFIYQRMPVIYYKTKDNERKLIRTYQISHMPLEFSDGDVYKYLKLRGEI
ncbi:MAG: hypothetical protein N4A54_14670 [Peptostreptococcaceae bacterium]|jgi:hypothetical protein|nr:hypothetical protein [Peptostreptococcaceae bacterium]